MCQKKRSTHTQTLMQNVDLMHFTLLSSLFFLSFFLLLPYVISRLDNVSDVIDDSMPAPGRTLDGDELVDDV